MGGLLVISCRHPPVFFKPANKPFNGIALFIPFPVYLRPDFTAFPEGDYWSKASVFNLPAQSVTVVSFVANNRLRPVCYGLTGKFGRVLMIACLAWRQN
jgi:hypothetical protein